MELTVNGKSHQVAVPGDMPLLWVLRDVIGMTGTKFGCGIAACGACTVQLDGQPIRSCVTPVSAVAGKRITTIEAIGETAGGRRSRMPGSTSTFPNAATASPARSCRPRRCWPRIRIPTDADIDTAMSGNICRCGTYGRIRAAIKQAAGGPAVAAKGA